MMVDLLDASLPAPSIRPHQNGKTRGRGAFVCVSSRTTLESSYTRSRSKDVQKTRSGCEGHLRAAHQDEELVTGDHHQENTIHSNFQRVLHQERLVLWKDVEFVGKISNVKAYSRQRTTKTRTNLALLPTTLDGNDHHPWVCPMPPCNMF
eukprot:1050681-Amphidinium_carterae.1